MDLPQNDVDQVGAPPQVVVCPLRIHLGCTCRACGGLSWVTLRPLDVASPPSTWSCWHCLNEGKLGVGT